MVGASYPRGVYHAAHRHCQISPAVWCRTGEIHLRSHGSLTRTRWYDNNSTLLEDGDDGEFLEYIGVHTVYVGQ